MGSTPIFKKDAKQRQQTAGERERESESESESEREREREKERKTVYRMTRTRDIIRQPGRSNEINSE